MKSNCRKYLYLHNSEYCVI